MGVITDATFQAMNAELERKNILLQKFAAKYAPTTWLDIKAKVRNGTAKDHFVVGDELVGKYAYNGTEYDFPWVVADIDREVEWADGTKHPGLVLMAKYGTPETVQFDHEENTPVDLATEPNALDGWYYWGKNGSSYTALNLSTGDPIPTTYETVVKNGINHLDTVKYGYNRWSQSGYRQWLNSAAGVGLWWEAQHLGDIAPNELNSIPGFKAGLEADFLAAVTPVKIKTACNTVTDDGVIDTTLDTFFLPSIEEVYGVPQLAVVEGPYFPYWKEVTGLLSPSNDANDGRKRSKANTPTGAAVSLRCRSSHRGNANSAWCITTFGGLSTSIFAVTSYSSLPACVIS